jgi:uncharacterized glyoxalase superfamily protein PhnB
MSIARATRGSQKSTAMIDMRIDNTPPATPGAVAQGALITMHHEDAFYGLRRQAGDPDRNRWHFHKGLDRARARGCHVNE